MLDIFINIFGTTALLSIVAFLAKNLVLQRLEKSIKYKFDLKLIEQKSILDIEISNLESRLSVQNNLIQSLTNSSFSGLNIYKEKEINAIHELWKDMINFRKTIPGFFYLLDEVPSDLYDTMARNKDILNEINSYSLKDHLEYARLSSAEHLRIFAGDLLWSYYTAYRRIISLSLSHVSSFKVNQKYEHWHSKINLAILFKGTFGDAFDEIKSDEGKTSKMLSYIETSYINDSQKILKGEYQFFEMMEKSKKILEFSNTLRISSSD